MTIHVGVIGVGNMGQDHIPRLTRTLSGAQVVAVSDLDAGRANAVADACLGAFSSGLRTAVRLQDRPAFYDPPGVPSGA